MGLVLRSVIFLLNSEHLCIKLSSQHPVFIDHYSEGWAVKIEKQQILDNKAG